MLKMIADSHTHTRFSADGQDDMLDMCNAAIEKGLSYICFTDHFDNNPVDEGCNYFDYERYSAAIERARDQFGDKIQILKGVEVGEPHLYQRKFEQIAKKDFDYIMIGVHYLGEHYIGGSDIGKIYSNHQIFTEYYKEVLNAVKMGGFNLLAHFDVPKRYLKEVHGEIELIDEIIAELVKKDIAIEINTSPLRRGFNETTPDKEVLRKYVQAGGKKVTIGSDAHRTGEIAADFEYAYKLAAECDAPVGVFKDRLFIPI